MSQRYLSVCVVALVGAVLSSTVCRAVQAQEELSESSFFDPGKLADARTLEIGGYLSAEFLNVQGEDRPGVPSYDQATLALFLGIPVYEEKVYASAVIEFFNRARPFGTLGARQVAVESAAIRVAPLTQLHVSAGAFLVPFGLEDDEHSSVINPLITRPVMMAGTVVYPGSWTDFGVKLSWMPPRLMTMDLYTINGDHTNQRLALLTQQSVVTSGLAAETREQPVDSFSGGVPIDGNESKSYGVRVKLDRLLDGLDVGGSGMWGHYDEDGERFNWLAGAHLDLDWSQLLAPVIGELWPLPQTRAEWVRTFEEEPFDFSTRDRYRWGVYAQVVQPLYGNIDGVFRYEFYDPDFDSTARDDEAQNFAFGLRWRPWPNTVFKGEYQVRDENVPDDPPNNLFAVQAAVSW